MSPSERKRKLEQTYSIKLAKYSAEGLSKKWNPDEDADNDTDQALKGMINDLITIEI